MERPGKPASARATGSPREQCVCFNLRKAARAVSQTYDDFLRPSGLRTTQFSLLALLAGEGPLTIRALADRMVMDRTTLTRNLKLVERAGHVRIGPGRDRRTRIVEVTPKGRQAVKAALPLWQQAQDKMVSELGPDTWSALRGSLAAAVDAAQAE